MTERMLAERAMTAAAITAGWMPAEHRIDLRGLTKRFGDYTALAPLDLTVAPGEFVVLLGPANAGKTTVLRAIAGLETMTAGVVFIDGFDVTPMPPQRRDVAFVFDAPALYPHLTVERNIAFPLRAQGIPTHAATRRAEEVIDRLHLEHIRRRRPWRLGAGEAQLVGLGRAMVRDAKVFLFDEPLAPFDGEQRNYMRRELRAIHQELRATTIAATRDPLDALALADRIVVMNEGRMLQSDAPQALADRPADLFVARYLGDGAMSFLDAARVDDIVRLACCDLAMSVDDRGAQPVDPARLTLGIRPQHVRFDPAGVIAVAGAVAVGDATGTQTVDLRLGEATVRAIVPADRPIAEGERVPICFDPAGCRWFDATSGKSLPWQTHG